MLGLSTNTASPSPAQQAPPLPREVLALEERLHRLEALVGQQSNLADLQTSVYPESIVHQASVGSSVPLIKVAQQLEERIALLDTKTLDTIKAKSKLLRSDLESLTSGSSSGSTGAAAKAVSTAATNEIKIFEAAKKIEGFAERVRQIESVADDLPVLAARLKTLENVHWNATTTVQRLDELETQAKDLASLLQSNDEVSIYCVRIVSIVSIGYSHNYHALFSERGRRKGHRHVRTTNKKRKGLISGLREHGRRTFVFQSQSSIHITTADQRISPCLAPA